MSTGKTCSRPIGQISGSCSGRKALLRGRSALLHASHCARHHLYCVRKEPVRSARMKSPGNLCMVMAVTSLVMHSNQNTRVTDDFSCMLEDNFCSARCNGHR